jgi:hypothetical protein
MIIYIITLPFSFELLRLSEGLSGCSEDEFDFIWLIKLAIGEAFAESEKSDWTELKEALCFTIRMSGILRSALKIAII